MPGQMLHGQLSLGYLLCDSNGPTNLPLKFMEAGVSKTTFPAIGWVGGWPVKMEIRLNSALAEARAWLSLAIHAQAELNQAQQKLGHGFTSMKICWFEIIYKR